MKPQRAVRCNNCDQDLRSIKEYHYKVLTEIWLKVAKSGEHLCIQCLEQRLGRRLVPSDFTNESINRPNQFSKSARLLNRLSKEVYKMKQLRKGE